MKLWFIILIVMVTTVRAESAYVLTLGYTDNELLFSGISIKNVPLQQPSLITGNHVIEQWNFAGSISHKNSFQPATGTFTVATPYQSDTREIIIRNPQEEAVLSIPVLQFADTCNNEICEPQESFETCSQDCHSGRQDDYCDEIRDGICDLDCTGTFDADCRVAQAFETPQTRKPIEGENTAIDLPEEKSTSINLIIALAGGLVLILVVGISFAVVHTKKMHRIKQMKEYVTQTLSQGYTLQQVQEALRNNGYEEKEIRMAMVSQME